MKALIFVAALGVSGIALAQDMQQPGQPAQPPVQDTQTPPADPQASPPDAQTPAPEMQTPTQAPPQDTQTPAAQDTQTPPSGQTVDDPSQATGPQGITQQGTDPSGQAAAPMGTNQVPAGTGMAVPAPGQQAAFTPRPATGEYPSCTRTVTDNCIQTYERGVRRSRSRSRR